MNPITYLNGKRKRAVHQRTGRAGITMFELIISAMILISVMSFITTICVQINFIWKDIGHHRAAVNELSNQLETMTRMTPEQARQLLEKLEPSAACALTLDRPELSGRLVNDNLGTRIEMQIDWKRRTPGQPVQLAGWLISSGKPKGEAAE